MDSIPRSRRALEAGSGGKVIRARQRARTATPYDRPSSPRPPQPPRENPSWLSRFLYSPTTSILSGAGKVISAVFESSSSADDSDDDDVGDEFESSQEDEGLMKRNGTSEIVLGQDETKHTIEQLLRQVTFSREECDRFIRIIKSRVVGAVAEDAETGPIMGTPDMFAPAVTEAKKWFMEKRSGSASKSDLDQSVMFPQDAEDAVGSPAHVAKLYMQARPPWASPIQHGELRSPSKIGMQLFNEDTPYSVGGSSVSKFKLKRDSSATGSWNIQEEIRRVRTKATEELLSSVPSKRIDWSAFALERRSPLDSLPDGKQEADMGEKLPNSGKAAGPTMNSSLGITATHTSEILALPAVTSSEQNKDLDAAWIDGKQGSQNALEEMITSGKRCKVSEDAKTSLSDCGGRKDINGIEESSAMVGETIQYSRAHDKTCSTMGEEVTGSKSANSTNGVPSSAPSLSAQLVTDETTVVNGEINPESSNYEKMVTNLLVEETYELRKETAIDLSKDNENDGTKVIDRVLVNETNIEVNENDIDGAKDNDSARSGSQNSSSMPDELSQERTQPLQKLKSTPTAKDTTAVGKPKASRLTRHNRRGKPRG